MGRRKNVQTVFGFSRQFARTRRKASYCNYRLTDGVSISDHLSAQQNASENLR
jgi:hypothetical protein